MAPYSHHLGANMYKDSQLFFTCRVATYVADIYFAYLRRMLIYFNMGVVLAKALPFSAFVCGKEVLEW